DLYDFEGFTVVLVPLNNVALFHRSGFKRDDPVQLSPRYDHAARMLSEMAWKLKNSRVKLGEFTKFCTIRGVETFFLKTTIQFISFKGFVMGIKPGKLPKRIRIKAEYLSHLAYCRPAAVRDHIGGHPGTAFTVFPINVLNYVFAIIA